MEHIETPNQTASRSNGKANRTATPADWMEFGAAMGWSITAMSTGKPVRFEMSNGEAVHVSDTMRRDIMNAIERAKKGGAS